MYCKDQQGRQVLKKEKKKKKRTLRSRYMLANLIFLGYSIGLLIIDFHPSFSGSSDTVEETTPSVTTTTGEPIDPLDVPMPNNHYINQFYVGQCSSKERCRGERFDSVSFRSERDQFDHGLSLLVGMA
jgi:hypothetical protein